LKEPTNRIHPIGRLVETSDLRLDVSDVRSRFFFGNENSQDTPSAGALVRPLWRAVAPGLRALRLPRAQLQVIFPKRATNYRALLRKITYTDKASYGSSSPCICTSTYVLSAPQLSSGCPACHFGFVPGPYPTELKDCEKSLLKKLRLAI